MLERRIGLMFSGQGSQVTELGKDFYERYESVRQLYDAYPHIRDIAFFGDEAQISKTRYTQRILILFQIAVVNLLKEYNIAHHCAMGLSLGEYGALYQANVLDQRQVIDIIEKRADSMADSSDSFNLSSFAILNGDFKWLNENDGNGFYISNINSATQQIITGENLEDIIVHLDELGYKKAVKLSVSGGFHSPYMKKTEDMLLNIFSDIEFKEAEMPIYFNYGGIDMPIRERMAKQVSHKIDVHNSLIQIESDCDLLIEIGANKVLESLVKKINKKKEVMKIQTVEDFEKVRIALGN